MPDTAYLNAGGKIFYSAGYIFKGVERSMEIFRDDPSFALRSIVQDVWYGPW